MKIGEMRTRVTFQKHSTVTDQYGNHTSAWTDYFSCWATAVNSGRSTSETENAGSTQESTLLDFTVRWSSEIDTINSKQYRILLRGRVYNITSIDEMGFKHNSRKFHTELVER